MQSKKALFVLSSFSGGGAEKNIVRYSRELAGSGYDVTVITLTDQADFEVPEIFHWKILPHVKTRLRFIRRRIQARLLRRLIDAEGGLHSFAIKVSTLPESDKVVSLLHDETFIYRFANDYRGRLATQRGIPGVVRAAKKFLLRRTYANNKILCVSEGMMESARDLLGRSDPGIRLIYNSFDFENIRELAKAPDPDIPDKPYIIHVGRSVEQKRHDLLINAFKESGAGVKLVLLGKTGQRVRRWVKEAALEDKVIFLDYKQNPYPLIANAKALVLSSDREGLPGVLIEALICGTPVVSTNCKYGPSEILTGDQARFLVETDNVAALARAIGAVLTNPPDLATVDLEKFRSGRFVRALEDFAAQ
jgi:glycosyltransferase involved in cell wall biosynthesis